MGPTVEVNLHDHFRLDPDRLARAAFLGRNGFKGGILCLQGLQLAKKRARDLMAEAGAGTSCVMQFAALIKPQHEGPDCLRICR